MKFSLCGSSFLLLVMGHASVVAQSTEAARYVNTQGIEVIQARRPAAGDEPQKGIDTASALSKKPTTLPLPAHPPVGPVDSKFQVSTKEQGSRDRDRLEILNQELAKEIAAYTVKLKLLQNPATKSKLSTEEFTRLQETAVDHEKNTRALTAEIARARQAR